ncbi:DNA-directed RNA polymerases II 24 kDa polypeptide (RNA polymerase II subunit 5) [Naganishia albida]|nr:DNA-directed RNA polymerases II 24 kDa polypeptide (RNA polymerase II subunit 5) [Naganishia albida]
MDNDSKDVARMWKVNRTLKEMVRDRGYLVGDDEIQLSFNDFRAQYGGSGAVDRSAMAWFTSTREDQQDTIYVFFSDEENVAKKTVRKFIGDMEEKRFRRGIFVYRRKMTPAAKKVIQEMQSEYTMEDYAEADLIVNITKHFLVPKHEIMTSEEKQALLQRYRLRETQLPRIQLGDPVARYYGLRRGQVMKITRESETAGRYVTYRVGM